MISRSIATLVLLCMAVLAQAPAPLRFEVATIKPSDSPQPLPSITWPAGRLSAVNAPLSTLLGFSLGGVTGTVTGGPSCATQDRYTVQAQAEGTPTIEVKRQMLHTLLTERFAVKYHRESKQVDVYALVLARSDGKLGPKVRPFTEECAPPAVRCMAQATPTGFHLVGSQMGAVTAMLSGARFGLGRKVEDRTGLTGRFYMDFEFIPPAADGKNADPLASEGVSIFTALQEQLGFKLEAAKRTIENVIIDSAQRPTEN